MEKFKQITLDIDGKYYQPHVLTGSKKDNLLFNLLKGMKTIEQEKLDVSTMNTDEDEAVPKVIVTIHFSDELWSKINTDAFNHRMIVNQWIDVCLKTGQSDKADVLTLEQINVIYAEIKAINDIVRPYYQQDLDRITFATQMAEKYPAHKYGN